MVQEGSLQAPARQDKGGDEQQWLMTFADLLSLILTFFVLLYSMSIVEQESWADITFSLSQHLNPKEDALRVLPSEELSVTTVRQTKATGLGYLQSVIRDKFLDTDMLDTAFSVQKLEDRLVISLTGKTVFEKAGVTLTEQSEAALFALSQVLHPVNNHIDVYGYASPEPIETVAFPSNWELALARAFIVSQLLRNSGYGYKISMFGRALPKAALGTTSSQEAESVRDRLARRVDIVIRDYPANR